ncbi:thyroid adenoma-associated protein homolog [Actinia tenebrosa]|uniref:tRNA (32-2'-O)-methyltransferase regulator THADA n=1 Tax=Actinia tenebrosa TaxID=6105 RepID=A0A6P8H3V8_ACTTE|nr:thyroid adenoma-associated protein homolog [Actinia tenebrosa]
MKKPKQIYHQRINIDDCYVIKLKDLQHKSSISFIDLLLKCLNEIDSIKQTALLKKIGSAFNEVTLEEDITPDANVCLEVLTEIFVVLDFKNPTRRALASLFDSLPESFYNTASRSLSSSVIKKLQDYENKVTADVDLRPAIDMVSSLMENFNLGNDIIKLNGEPVLNFLATCLQHLVSRASVAENPVDQTTRMMDCLATIKTVIAVLQKNSNKIIKEAQSNGSNLHLWVDHVKGIMEQLMQVLNQEFLPDCQTASGMTLCLIVYLFSRRGSVAEAVLETVFPHHAEQNKQQTTTPDWITKVFQAKTWEVPISYNQLCLCHGVLTMIPLEDLLSPISHKDSKDINLQEKQTLMFDMVFPDLCQLLESLKDSFSCLSAFKVITLWAEQARRAAELHLVPYLLKSLLTGSAVIPQKLLSFVWDYWDHPVEVVRHQTKAIFEHVIRTHMVLSDKEPSADDFLKNLTGKLIEVGWHSRGIYGPLCCLTSAVGAKTMLGWYPCIPVQVINVLKDRIIAPHVIDFLDVITKAHKQEIISQGDDMDGWLKTWVVPLVNILRTEGSQEEGVLMEHSLSKLFKCYPESLQFIVGSLSCKQDKHVEILMTCLKTARRLGIIKVNNNTNKTDIQAEDVWGGVVPVDWLKKALCHVENQTRLDALGLLCDSPRTTEPISLIDLALLKVFLPLNMNNQSPSFRQQCVTHLKKLLTRMKECIRIEVKKLEKTRESLEESQRLESYKEFLHWFSDILFTSLFPGASFTRRVTSLHYLKLLSTIFNNDKTVKGKISAELFVFDDVMTDDNIAVLLECFNDTYEVNKTLAYELLTNGSPKSLPFQTPEVLQLLQQKISHLVSSPRAVDASTASITLKLLIDRCLLPLYPESPTCLRNSGNIDSQAYRVICYLLSSLRKQSLVAETSLHQASYQAPMHGLVYCLREVLGHIKLSRFSCDTSWQQLVSSLLDECFHVSDLVSPVVTCSSPEGHLIDEEYDDDTDLTSVPEDDPTSSEVFNNSSQVLLVCCWRTMKEVALILGDIVQNAPIKAEESGLLTPKQVHQIGDFFTTVLLTSKHRGAFELAYTGFVKLCSTLWICEDASLRQLPHQWLSSLMSDITASVPSEIFCGTRRSAGVPFFVQAIVTTEPMTAGKASFKRLMTDLIVIAEQPIDKNVPKDSTIPQVHARNILRALYRDTRLGEDVFPFVASGLMIAVRGFLSDSWAIRNSSTLLFSALMTRIFGVKKSKDEHSRRNCMTGREFFTRFPELHSFLLEEMKKATEAIEKSLALDLHPSLYPVLVLLSRLYPSSMDGVDSTLNMSAFIPYVIRCGGSSVLKTRAMAARAIVPLVAGECLVQVLQDLMNSLPVRLVSVEQNKMHGTLLQIQHLVHEHLVEATPSENIKSLVTSKVLQLFDKLSWIADSSNPCAMTCAVFLDITFKLFICLDWQTTGLKCKHLSTHTTDNVLHMRRYITHTALRKFTIVRSRPRMAVSVGEVLVKEICARICLKAVSACGMNSGADSGSDQEHVRETMNCTQENMVKRMSFQTPNHHQVIKCLLNSQDYEVRLVTLEHLNAYLSRNHSLSRSVDIASYHGNHDNGEILDGLTEALERVVLAESHLEDIAVDVLEMAMEREQHLDCLGQVYEVLSFVVGYLCFPITFSTSRTVSLVECWQHVLQQAQRSGQRDSVRCALLHFLSSMAGKVYQKLINANDDDIKTKTLDAVLSLNELFKSTSEEHQSIDVRYKTADILSNGSLSSLMWDPSRQLGYFPLDLWSVVIRLLHDDDSSVRDCMTSVLSVQPSTLDVHNKPESSSLPTLAIEVVLDRVWSEFYIRESDATLHWILEWITAKRASRTADTPIGACPEAPSEHASKIDLLFEKNSLNSYQEKEIIAEAALKTLKNHQREISEPGSDIVDDVNKEAIEVLEKITHESSSNFSGSFSRIYLSVLGLTAAEVIATASSIIQLSENKIGVAESEVIHNPNSCSPCPTRSNIPSRQITETVEKLKTIMETLCSRIHMKKELENAMDQPKLRKALRELSFLSNIDIHLFQ